MKDFLKLFLMLFCLKSFSLYAAEPDPKRPKRSGIAVSYVEPDTDEEDSDGSFSGGYTLQALTVRDTMVSCQYCGCLFIKGAGIKNHMRTCDKKGNHSESLSAASVPAAQTFRSSASLELMGPSEKKKEKLPTTTCLKCKVEFPEMWETVALWHRMDDCCVIARCIEYNGKKYAIRFCTNCNQQIATDSEVFNHSRILGCSSSDSEKLKSSGAVSRAAAAQKSESDPSFSIIKFSDTCSGCGVKIFHKEVLKQHLGGNHAIEFSDSDDSKIHRCKLCKKDISKIGELTQHGQGICVAVSAFAPSDQ